MVLNVQPKNVSAKRRSVYEAPELYRLAFAHRNIALEVTSLIRWFKKVTGDRKPPATVLELAAGPADHAIEFAKRGIHATALDLSPMMCRFARREALEQGVLLKVVTADMISFRTRGKYDLVCTMLDSVNNIHKLPDMIKHLRSVAECLTDGGIYVIELTQHEKKGQPLKAVKWRVTRHKTKARVSWTPLAARSNGKSLKVSLEIDANDQYVRLQLTDILHLRTWHPKEMQTAISRSGCFKIADRYGDFRTDIASNDKDARNYILVLQKQSLRKVQ